jgi:hypothetical protein
MSLRDIEMECIDHGTELPPADHVRRFYREYSFVVGASDGEETHYVYVEWSQDGSVHGRPITRTELVNTKGLQA